MLYAINTVLLYKNGPLLSAITCFLGAICYKKQGVAAICYKHVWAFAICYILLNGICYMLLHTPWGALLMGLLINGPSDNKVMKADLKIFYTFREPTFFTFSHFFTDSVNFHI